MSTGINLSPIDIISIYIYTHVKIHKQISKYIYIYTYDYVCTAVVGTFGINASLSSPSTYNFLGFHIPIMVIGQQKYPSFSIQSGAFVQAEEEVELNAKAMGAVIGKGGKGGDSCMVDGGRKWWGSHGQSML